ncbi:glycosyltransferase, partial [Streptomyces sp. 2MCAF27]
VFLEAAAAGLPVLAGDSGGAPDAVRDGETGHVVDGRATRAIADRLIALLQDRPTARAMGEKGRAWVRQEWSWDASYRTLARLLSPQETRPGLLSPQEAPPGLLSPPGTPPPGTLPPTPPAK